MLKKSHLIGANRLDFWLDTSFPQEVSLLSSPNNIIAWAGWRVKCRNENSTPSDRRGGTISCNVTQIFPTAPAPFIVQSSIIFYQIFFSPLKMFINCIHTILWELSGQTTVRVRCGDWHSAGYIGQYQQD